jgi:hypothetical protein
MLKEPLTIDVDKFKRYLIKSEDLFADTMIALIDDYIKKPPEPPG